MGSLFKNYEKFQDRKSRALNEAWGPSEQRPLCACPGHTPMTQKGPRSRAGCCQVRLWAGPAFRGMFPITPRPGLLVTSPPVPGTQGRCRQLPPASEDHWYPTALGFLALKAGELQEAYLLVLALWEQQLVGKGLRGQNPGDGTQCLVTGGRQHPHF